VIFIHPFNGKDELLTNNFFLYIKLIFPETEVPLLKSWVVNMKLQLFLILLVFNFQGIVQAQDKLLINVYNRESINLDGSWRYIVDPYENGFYNYRYEPFENQASPPKSAFFTNSKPVNKQELIEYDFDNSDSINVPGDWNTQKGNLYYYEGTVWYKKSFDHKLTHNHRLFVYFEGANYQTDVYLNGKKLGQHIGGFTPFNFEITDFLNEKDNFLIVKVDNKRVREGVPTLNTDWWNYGGITREVRLIETGKNFVEDYFIQLSKEDNEKIIGSVTLNGAEIAGKNVQVLIPELQVDEKFVTNPEGRVSFEIKSENIQYWSVENPYLYQIKIITDEDQITDQIGFRTIHTKGSNILLNGESIFLKGISIHEESPIHDGRAYSEDDARVLLSRAKELGCNYVRLAHYPHNENMVRLADKIGMLVWEEIPVYWTIDWENKETYLNAKNQLTEVISRDKNRASVIIWSMANETPAGKARNLFLTNLRDHTRKLDPTRLISAALEQKNYQGDPNVKIIDDPIADIMDVLSFNQYIGWYDGLPGKCENISWKIDQEKPVIISEFGAGAKQGFHGAENERWTEEYQEYLYVETLKMIKKIDQLRGISPWILVDFRSPRRVLPGIQDDWNRKGLISEDGKKKKAFFVLQEAYNKNILGKTTK